MIKRHIMLPHSATLACLILLCAPGFAQEKQRKPHLPLKKNDAQAERSTQMTPVSLPDLPLYSGKVKWRYTIVCPKVETGPTYTMRFEAKEDPQTVLSWYAGTMQSSQWKIKQSLGSIIGDSAHGNSCIINCYPKTRGDFKSNVTIVYKQMRKQ